MKIVNHANYIDHYTTVSKSAVLVDDELQEVVVLNPHWMHPAVSEQNILPSRTVPDQALSLREMVARYAQGGSVEMFQPVYTDNELIPDNWERWDEIDRIEYARALKIDLKARTDEFLSQQKMEKDEAVQKAAEFEARKAMAEEPPPSQKAIQAQ